MAPSWSSSLRLPLILNSVAYWSGWADGSWLVCRGHSYCKVPHLTVHFLRFWVQVLWDATRCWCWPWTTLIRPHPWRKKGPTQCSANWQSLLPFGPPFFLLFCVVQGRPQTSSLGHDWPLSPIGDQWYGQCLRHVANLSICLTLANFLLFFGIFLPNPYPTLALANSTERVNQEFWGPISQNMPLGMVRLPGWTCFYLFISLQARRWVQGGEYPRAGGRETTPNQPKVPRHTKRCLGFEADHPNENKD